MKPIQHTLQVYARTMARLELANTILLSEAMPLTLSLERPIYAGTGPDKSTIQIVAHTSNRRKVLDVLAVFPSTAAAMLYDFHDTCRQFHAEAATDLRHLKERRGQHDRQPT